MADAQILAAASASPRPGRRHCSRCWPTPGRRGVQTQRRQQPRPPGQIQSLASISRPRPTIAGFPATASITGDPVVRIAATNTTIAVMRATANATTQRDSERLLAFALATKARSGRAFRHVASHVRAWPAHRHDDPEVLSSAARATPPASAAQRLGSSSRRLGSAREAAVWLLAGARTGRGASTSKPLLSRVVHRHRMGART